MQAAGLDAFLASGLDAFLASYVSFLRSFLGSFPLPFLSSHTLPLPPLFVCSCAGLLSLVRLRLSPGVACSIAVLCSGVLLCTVLCSVVLSVCFCVAWEICSMLRARSSRVAIARVVDIR